MGEEAHVRVFFFHAHIYYDPEGPQKEKMLALHKNLQKDFKDDPNVEVHTLQVKNTPSAILLTVSITFHDDVHTLKSYRCIAANSISDLQEGAVGPHPTANLEVLFTRDRFTYMLCYMTFNVAPTFSTLIHELTADQVKI